MTKTAYNSSDYPSMEVGVRGRKRWIRSNLRTVVEDDGILEVVGYSDLIMYLKNIKFNTHCNHVV